MKIFKLFKKLSKNDNTDTIKSVLLSEFGKKITLYLDKEHIPFKTINLDSMTVVLEPPPDYGQDKYPYFINRIEHITSMKKANGESYIIKTIDRELKMKEQYLIFPSNAEIAKLGFSYEVVDSKHQYLTQNFMDIYKIKKNHIQKCINSRKTYLKKIKGKNSHPPKKVQIPALKPVLKQKKTVTFTI